MILIQEILVSDEVINAQFACNLQACKGACCWEGDFGAPLEQGEKERMRALLPALAPFLTDEGKSAIQQKGPVSYYPEEGFYGTTLREDGACAFITFDEATGIAGCGFEKAWEAGLTGFQKPVSCHLYPVRVSKNEHTGFEALNYDKWDICNAACRRGREEQIPLYQFVKEGLVRRYGTEFYEALEAAAGHLLAEKGR